MAKIDSRGQSEGGRGVMVSADGLALLRAGELVLPAAGSEAQAEQVFDDARAVVHYYFPVEIEVRAAGDVLVAENIVQETLNRLADVLETS